MPKAHRARKSSRKGHRTTSPISSWRRAELEGIARSQPEKWPESRPFDLSSKAIDKSTLWTILTDPANCYELPTSEDNQSTVQSTLEVVNQANDDPMRSGTAQDFLDTSSLTPESDMLLSTSTMSRFALGTNNPWCTSPPGSMRAAEDNSNTQAAEEQTSVEADVEYEHTDGVTDHAIDTINPDDLVADSMSLMIETSHLAVEAPESDMVADVEADTRLTATDDVLIRDSAINIAEQDVVRSDTPNDRESRAVDQASSVLRPVVVRVHDHRDSREEAPTLCTKLSMMIDAMEQAAVRDLVKALQESAAAILGPARLGTLSDFLDIDGKGRPVYDVFATVNSLSNDSTGYTEDSRITIPEGDTLDVWLLKYSESSRHVRFSNATFAGSSDDISTLEGTQYTASQVPRTVKPFDPRRSSKATTSSATDQHVVRAFDQHFRETASVNEKAQYEQFVASKNSKAPSDYALMQSYLFALDFMERWRCSSIELETNGEKVNVTKNHLEAFLERSSSWMLEAQKSKAQYDRLLALNDDKCVSRIIRQDIRTKCSGKKFYDYLKLKVDEAERALRTRTVSV